MYFPFNDLLTVEDFLENDAFRLWLTERRPEDRIFWQEWLAQHPERKETYEQAVVTFLTVQGQRTFISDQQVNEKTAEILSQLPGRVTTFKPVITWHWAKWAAAAAVAGTLFWWQSGKPVQNLLSLKNGRENQRSFDEGWQVVNNGTSQSMVVLLPDNSSVLLSKDSQLRYRKQPTDTVRRVFLQGEAFFEVSKDPRKPFVVYTTNLSTKVLGTSFQIRSFDKETTSFVRVKTGKVNVTPATAPGTTVSLSPNEKLSLAPRGRLVLKRERLSATEHTTAIIDEPFDYEYTPVTELFTQLEEQYHMPIRYNKELIRNCTFTGKLNDVPFLEKIRLVCLTIESTYELTDNQIIIQSTGCN